MISVVIPTYHRPELLKKCLQRLDKVVQDVSIPYQVIVSDDSINDATSTMIKTEFKWVDWVKGPRKGPAANRNNGVKNSIHRWIVFLDDDCVPEPSLIQSYVSCIEENRNYKVFEGKIIPIGEQTRFDQECPINTTGGLLWSCNFCIEKEFFFTIGGFDERFPFAAMEDIDLRIRVLERQEIYFCSNATVKHPWVIRNTKATVEKHFKSTLIFLEIHKDYKNKINSIFYLRWVARDICFNYFKNCFRYNFRGSQFIIMKYLLNLKYSVLLLAKKG